MNRLNQRKGFRHWMLLLILLLAAFLRFWQMEAAPPGLYHDEAYNGLDALSLLQGKHFPQFYEGWELYAQDAHADNPLQKTRFPLFFEGNYGREPIHIYLMALSIKLFGITPFAIRVVPAAAGVLAVFTTYLAVTQLFKNLPFTNQLPLIAAFVLAVMFPAVHFSRFGLRVMLFLPVETMAIYFFWRGVNGSNKGWGQTAVCFAAAGFVMGLGLYVYAAGRLFPLLFVLFIPLWFWLNRAAVRRFWRQAALMAGVAVLTAAPLLLFFIHYPYFFFFRIAYVANKGKGTVAGKAWLTWLLNVGRVFGGLFWHGETHLRHNLPGRPYLDPVQAIFFFIGLGRAIKERLDQRILFLLLWLVVMLLPSILSGDAPHFGRMAGAAPPLAALVALGVAGLGGWVQSRLHSLGQWQARRWIIPLSGWLMLVLLLFSGWSTFYDYFGRYASEPDLARDFYLPDWNLGRFAAAQPTQTRLYLTPAQEEMATIYFALADPERLRSYNGGSGLIPAGVPGQPALYLVRPSDPSSLQDLRQFYPKGDVEELQAGVTPFRVFQTGWTAENETAVSYAGKIKLLGWSLTPETDVLRLRLVWQAQAVMARDYTVFVHLLDGMGAIVAQVDRPPAGYPTSDWRPGEVVVDDYLIPLPADLLPGTYTLATGFYDWPTLVRLGDTAVLGGALTIER